MARKAKKRNILSYNVGGCSILIIFITICLTTFATLSMVSANSDYKLSLKTAENNSEYYSADSKAEKSLGEIDSVLKEHLNDTKEDYINNVSAELSLNDSWIVSNNNDSLEVTYIVPISEKQDLQCTLDINYPNSNGKRYKVRSWKVVTKAEEMEEEPLNVWNPGK